MVVCTPKGQYPLRITFGTVPWFNFQERFNFSPQFTLGLDNHIRSPVTFLFSPPCSSEDPPISALVLPKLLVPHTHDAPPTISDMAEVISDHEHHQNIPLEEQSSEVSSARTALELAHATIFMSSNNNLSYDDTDRFVKSIVDNKMRWVLKTILAPRTPTTEILATNILIVACQYDDVRTVSLLMSMGADVNVLKKFPESRLTTTQLMSPLCMAIRNGRLAVVEKLIEGGAKLNLHPEDHLMEALASPKTDKMVQLLLEKGIDVERSSILAFVVASGNIELTRILLKAGAFNGAWKVTCTYEFWLYYKDRVKIHFATPLQIAAEKDDLMMVHALLDGDRNVNVPSRQYLETPCFGDRAEYCQTGHISPLVHAVSNGNLEMIMVLLNAGADINFCAGQHLQGSCKVVAKMDDPNNWESDSLKGRFLRRVTSTALQTAVFQENLGLVQFLLEAGAYVDTYECGHTALQIAVKRNNTHLTRLLLAFGANIHAPARWLFGRTAMQAASETGNVTLLQLLLAKTTGVLCSTSINAPPSRIGGRTAIQAAAGNGHIEMVQYLLGLGADINGSTAEEHGAKALQAAARSRNPDMVMLVLAAGASINTPSGTVSALAIAIENHDLPIFELLLDYVVDICFDSAGKSGWAQINYLPRKISPYWLGR